MTELRVLLEDLRAGARPGLSLEQVELLLGWLNGSAVRDTQAGGNIPHPGHDPVLLQMVFYRLDDVLFAAGELRLEAAGLGADKPATRRRIRYRRLASAFHPDRFPELDDWLTQRSQAVHRAYARFKRDPDAPAPPAARDPGIRTQSAAGAGTRMRTRPRPARKRPRQRLKALGEYLRARFGNDRFLAHKLIGGLAVIALLPVMNMVLAPEAPSTGESATGTERSRSDTAPTAGSGIEEATGAGAVSGRDRSAPEAPPTAEPDGKSGESNSATVAENGKRKTENDALSAPEVTPLLAAARRAMNPNGHPTPVATLPSVDEQLAAMGLETDTERLYRRMGDEEKETVDAGEEQNPVSGFRLPVSGEKQREATADSGPVSVGAGAGRGQSAQDAPPTGESATGAERSRSDTAPTAGSGTEQATGVGAVSDRDQSAPETPSTAELGSRSDTAPTAATSRAPVRKPKTVDGTPAESGTEQATGVGAVSDRDLSAAETPPAAEPNAESEESDLAMVAENGKRKTGNAGNADDNQGPETGSRKPKNPARSAVGSRSDTAPTAGSDTGQVTGVGAVSDRDQSAPEAPPTAGSGQAPEAPARKPSTVNRQPAPSAPPALEPGELVLGPLGPHPVGKVLGRLHAVLGDGDVPGVAAVFAGNARLDALVGQGAIAGHFRAMLARADVRRVDLRVRRFERDGAHWRVEAELEIRVLRDGQVQPVLEGRSTLWLAERGGELKITHMEHR